MADVRRAIVKGIGTLAFLTLAIPIVLIAPGCQGRECESDGYKDYGYGPGEGHLVDQNTWESTPNNATWLPFGPYHLWGIHPVGLEGRDLVLIQVYYSADPDPNDPGNNFTTGSGNGATMSVSPDSRTVFVSNGTCAPTYLRVVIVADPLPPTVPSDDGGVSGVIGIDDAGDAGAIDLLDAGDASD